MNYSARENMTYSMIKNMTKYDMQDNLELANAWYNSRLKEKWKKTVIGIIKSEIEKIAKI
jgi:hypothetical protein